jgi:hypothetical protein
MSRSTTRQTLFVYIILFTVHFTFGQTVTTYNSDSTVVISRDAKFDELLKRQKEQNLITQTMHGYRIQIYFGANRQKANDIKSDFNTRYPDVQSYLSYQQPNFKVRIGDYRNRLEAQKFLKDIEGLFPTSFIVPDEVRLPPLK